MVVAGLPATYMHICIKKLSVCSVFVFCVSFPFQGDGTYFDYQTIVVEEQIFPPPPTCSPVWNGALVDIVQTHKIPASMLVLGKIVAQDDGNNGWIDPAGLAALLKQAMAGPVPGLAGVFGWQWGSDTNGQWIDTVLTAWD